MHRRGRVQFLDEHGNIQQEMIRASVWIEQEIAIAAFLSYISGRNLHVQAFAESGIAREGVRDQLLINPITFTNSTEVLEQLRQVLPTWKTSLQPSEVELELKSQMMARDDLTERHLLQLLARNSVKPRDRQILGGGGVSAAVDDLRPRLSCPCSRTDDSHTRVLSSHTAEYSQSALSRGSTRCLLP